MQRTLRYGLEIGGLPLLQRLAKLFAACVERGHEFHELFVCEGSAHRCLALFQPAIGRGAKELLPVRVGHVLMVRAFVENGKSRFGLGGIEFQVDATGRLREGAARRNSATLPLKYAEKAGFSRYCLNKSDQRKWPLSCLAPVAAVFLRSLHWWSRFQKPARANA
jgi:hypothetical protein